MSYTPPYLFTDGTVLSATELGANLSAIATYYTGGVNSADLEVDTLQTTHVVRPQFVPINDNLTSVYFQTGSVHTLTLPHMDWVGSRFAEVLSASYVPNGFIAEPIWRADNGKPSYNMVPRVCASFYVYKTSSLFVRINGGIFIPYDNTGAIKTSNKFYIQLDGDGTKGYESMCRIPESDNGLNVFGGRPLQTCALFTNLSPGWHHVGLVAGLDSNLGVVQGVQMVAEVIHTGV